MDFGYLLTQGPAAFLLVLVGVFTLTGAFYGSIAWHGLDLHVTGLAKIVAFLTGGVCVALGLFQLIAPGAFRYQPIRIETAIYGIEQLVQPTVPPFPAGTLDCTDYARQVCDDHPECSLTFTNGTCGRDPIGGAFKMAEVIYRCGNEPSTRAFFVERRAGTLVCR
jgi:hypothetical protein